MLACGRKLTNRSLMHSPTHARALSGNSRADWYRRSRFVLALGLGRSDRLATGCDLPTPRPRARAVGSGIARPESAFAVAPGDRDPRTRARAVQRRHRCRHQRNTQEPASWTVRARTGHAPSGTLDRRYWLAPARSLGAGCLDSRCRSRLHGSGPAALLGPTPRVAGRCSCRLAPRGWDERRRAIADRRSLHSRAAGSRRCGGAGDRAATARLVRARTRARRADRLAGDHATRADSSPRRR